MKTDVLKNLLFTLLLAVCCLNCNLATSEEFELPLYDGWNKETIPFPLSFAPGIGINGLEELRFSPGMFSEESEEYWSYLFLWWVDTETTISKPDMERYLEEYFSGLAKEIAPFRKRNASGATYDVSLDSIGEKQFLGSSVLSNKAIDPEIPSLKIRIHQSICKPQRRLAVLFELSPKPLKHRNWQTLSKLKSEFKCD